MIDTKALRNRILDLAIQGKLTEQLESDGTAEELYQQIQAEKQALIKEGKIKKEKPLLEISADEIPFEIPSNWKWVKFGNIIALQSGQDLTKDEYNDKSAGIPYMTGASNYNDDGSLIINRWTEMPKALAENGDILLSCKGTVGKIAILSIDKVHIARQIMGIRVFIADNAYVSLFVKSAVNGIIAASKGLIPGIERKDVLNLNIPLPPLAEQKRIVERVEEIFRLLDTIDKAQEKYSADSQILKAKLITAGIQGKLTKQLESDGTAHELYKQIQEEKQKLIKEGKIKKEKPLPPISPDEIPFEIPQNWMWVRLKEISFKITDGTHHSPINTKNGDYMYVTAKNIKDKGVDLSNITYVTKEVHNEIYARCNPELNDILLIKDGATTGVVTVNNIDEPFSLLSSVALVKPVNKLIEPWYIAYVLRSSLFYKTIRTQMTGTGITRIVLRQIEPFIVPLPPLAEQKRIADVLERVLGVVE